MRSSSSAGLMHLLSAALYLLLLVPSSVLAVSRNLEIGDFAIVNQVFRDLELEITVAEPIVIDAFGVGEVIVDITNLVCTDMNIGDVLINYIQRSETILDFFLDIVQFDISCTFDYAYSAPLNLNGQASAEVFTDDNLFDIQIGLAQPAPDLPPNEVTFPFCESTISISNINFNGGIVAGILNVVEGAIRNTIANEVETFLCDFISGLDVEGKELLDTIAELVAPYLDTVDSVDPLGPEIELNATLGEGTASLINFQNPQGTIGTGVAAILTEAGRVLGTERDDPDSPTGRDLGINVLIRNFLLDNDGAFSLDTSDLLNGGTLLDTVAGTISEVEIRIDRLELKGLDTFSRFDPFEDISAYTLQGSFAWNFTYLEVDLYIALGPPGSDEKVEENIKVSTRLDDLDFTFSLLLALDENDLASLTFGELINSTELVPCVFAATHAVEITSLVMTVGDIESPLIADFESPGLARLLGTGIEGLYKLLDDVVLLAVPGLFQSTIRDLLNEEIKKLTDGSECDKIEPKPDFTYVDFRDLLLSASDAKAKGGSGLRPFGDIPALLKGIVDDELLAVNPATGRPKINEGLIAPLTDFQSGVEGMLKFPGSIVEAGGGLDFGNLVANVFLELADFRVENMDTVLDPLILIQPIEESPFVLDNGLTIGLPERPLTAGINAYIRINGDGIDIRNEVDVTLGLVETQTRVDALAKLVTARMMAFPLRDLTNFNCWVSMIPAPELTPQGIREEAAARTAGLLDILVLIKNLKLNVTCIDCTSPGLQEMSRLLQTEEAEEDATRAANTVLDYFASLLDGEFVQIFVDRIINEAPAQCPHNSNYDPNFESVEYVPFEDVDSSGDSILFLIAVGGGIVGLLALTTIIGYVTRCLVRRRHKTWLSGMPKQKIFRIYREQRREDERLAYLRHSTKSLFTSEDVPCFVRLSIPLVLLGNIGLFLSGHLSLGGAVSIVLKFAGEEIEIDNVFEFSVADSAIQLWQAGGKELAIFILIFSGIWPYTKTLLTLITWFLSPRTMSTKRRGSLLLWLDSLAKWSSVDIFFLIVTLVAFKINVGSPDVAFLPDGFYAVDILLTPLWGLYANFIAQILSQVTSHIIIHYHRKVVKRALARQGLMEEQSRDFTDREEPSSSKQSQAGRPEVLNQHGFKRAHRGDADRLSIRPGINMILMIVAICVFGLLAIGAFVPTFAFEQLGVLGVAVEIGRQSDIAKNEFSVLGIAQALLDQAMFIGELKSYIGLGAIGALLIGTVILVPMLLTAVLMYQWFYPIKDKQRAKVETWIEILSSWQYVEVYLIAVLVSSWQLGPTSEFLINSYCDGLEDTFNSLVNYGVLQAEDAQCFRLKSSIEVGCFFLIGAAFLFGFLNLFVARAVSQYQRDKLSDEDKKNEGPDAVTLRLMATMDSDEVLAHISPAPVLFTDTFRWLLDSSSAPMPTEDELVEGSELNYVSIEPSIKPDFVVAPPARATSQRKMSSSSQRKMSSSSQRQMSFRAQPSSRSFSTSSSSQPHAPPRRMRTDDDSSDEGILEA